MGLMGQNTPLRFYGMVIDQDGKPVAKVKIKVSVRHWGLQGMAMEDMAKEIAIETKTAVDGRFYLHGATGDVFYINDVQKDGYKLSSHVQHGYGVVGGSLANPIIFRMWKFAGKEPLVASAWQGKVGCDGETNRFGLLHGDENTNGDLEIVCWKHPLTVPAPGNAHFDYRFEIAVHGGGIQPTTDEFTYHAPENGYSPAFTVSQRASDPGWQGGIKQEFYIKVQSGQYGRLYVEWYASQTPPTILRWDCSLNPSGSRHLER